MKIIIIRKVLLFTILLFSFNGNAQKRLLNWYSGSQVGLEFDCDLNVTEPGLNEIIIAEGSTCVSDDDDGSLLFYVSPARQLALSPDPDYSKKEPGIYDASHKKMPNGQMPYGNSPYQGAVTFPIGNSKYYVFYLSEGTGPETGITNKPALKYSVIDMDLTGNGTVANPLGDAVPGQTRVYVEDLSASAVTAVRHANGQDYWVVGAVSNDVIHAYKVSVTGVSTPVISSGMINLSSAHNMKFSSDGSKFASNFVVSDFDIGTGVFSNVFNISKTISGSAGLSVGGSSQHEFSPNCKYLYKFGKKYSNAWTSEAYLYRYNTADYTLAPDEYLAAYAGSNPSAPSSPSFHGDMQLHIDGNIYYVRYPVEEWPSIVRHPEALSAIMDPNSQAPTFVEEAILITSGTPNSHVPNFVTSWAMEVDAEDIIETLVSTTCAGTIYSFEPEDCGLVTSYEWNFGDGSSSTDKSPTHTYTASGTYTVELIVTNDSTCSIWNTDTLREDIVVVFQGDPIIEGPLGPFCLTGGTEIFTGSPAGGVWSGVGITNVATGEFDPAIAGLGSHKIKYEVTGAVCPGLDSIIIEVKDLFDPKIVAVGPFCEDEAEIQLMAVDPAGVWSGTGITNTADGIFDPVVAGSGTHTITYTISGPCGDVGTEDIIVNGILEPTFTAIDPICEGAALAPFPTTSLNTVLGSWSPTPNNTATTNYIFTPNLGECADSMLITVEVDENVDAGDAGVLNLCADGVVVDLFNALGGDPDIGGIWTPVTGTNNEMFNPLTDTPGDYEYKVESPLSVCEDDSARVTVTVADLSSLAVSGPDSVCFSDGSFELTVNLPGGIWSGSGVNSNTGIFDPSISGEGLHTINYDLTLGECSNSSSLDVMVKLDPTVEFSPSFVQLCAGESLLIVPNYNNAIDAILWNTGETIPTITITSDESDFGSFSSYDVEVSNSCGSEKATLSVEVKTCGVTAYVPNAFTPDGDEFNEVFKPTISGIDIYNYNMVIFDRWGEVLFESNNAEIGWDGTYGGELAQDGMYVWRLTYQELESTDKETITGHVVLLR